MKSLLLFAVALVGHTTFAQTPQTRPVADPTRPQPTTAYSAPASTATYTRDRSFGRIHLTVGPEFSYYPAQLNKGRDWLDDSTGFGMKQNIGASLRFDYRFLKPLAASVTVGYFGWELLRRYTRNGTDEYSETKRLTQIPVQLGLKLYPFGGLYVMPEGGVNLLFSSVKTSDAHPAPANESVRSTPISYGGSLGYEFRARALLLDLSVRYQLLNVSNLRYVNFNQTLNEQVSIGTVRLGIGFGSSEK